MEKPDEFTLLLVKKYDVHIFQNVKKKILQYKFRMYHPHKQ